MREMKKVITRKRRFYLWLTLISAFLIAGLVNGVYWVRTQQQIQASEKIVAIETAFTKDYIAQLEARKTEPVYTTLPGADKIEVLRDVYTDDDSLWKMVNKQETVSVDYVPQGLVLPSVPVSAGDRVVRTEVADALVRLFDAAQQDGYSLMVGSAYRSASYQQGLFNSYVASAGYDEASKYSALPGHSEHQLGLAVDLSTLSQQCFLSACFIGTAEGQWLAAHAHEYGFTLRYPEGKEAITGYNFEPWHYRYVGIPLATALHQSDLTLEEAWPYLQTALETLKKNRAPEVQ